MGKRTSYAPGTFSWVDLATPDAAGAKSFYGGVFGWDLEDTDAGGGAVYTMCRVDGDAVCGLYELCIVIARLRERAARRRREADPVAATGDDDVSPLDPEPATRGT